MPYLIMISTRSPYIPNGLEVLDEKPELFLPTWSDGELVLNQIVGGVPLDPEIVPRHFSVDVAGERLPDFFGLSVGYGVTDAFRDKVEELEPGVHQFFPISITAKGGESPKKRHWLLHICNRLDALDPDETDLPVYADSENYDISLLFGSRDFKIAVRKSLVNGKCMWMDRRISGLPFFSNELFSFIDENKMTKLESWSVESA